MKRVFLLLAVLFAMTWNVNAQDFRNGDFVANVGLGIGSGYEHYKMTVPPLSLSLDYCVVDNLIDGNASIGVGGYLAFASYRYHYHYYTYSYNSTLNRFALGARGTFHYQFVDNLDTYAGLVLGAYNYHYSYEDYYDEYYDGDDDHTSFYSSFFIGARYYVSNKVGIYAEAGSGIAFFNIGVSFKL